MNFIPVASPAEHGLEFQETRNEALVRRILRFFCLVLITGALSAFPLFGNSFDPVATSIPGLSGGSAAWGDFDNDGKLDLVVTGNDGTNRVCQLWRNVGTGFVQVSTALPGVDSGAAAWGDYNNDGRLDILLTGNTGSNRIT